MGYGWQPEYAKNWEVGYIHDLTGLFPKMKNADFRINYFRNKTKNIIDRDENFEFEQFDKQIRTGVELQARFDTGKFFGGVGVLRTLKNKVCDKSFAVSSVHDSSYLTGGGFIPAPECNYGGLTDNGYLASMVQPRWSVDADLGGRFFHNKLESGIRFHYHSRVYQNRRTVWQAYYDQLNRINDYNLQADTDTMRWQPVAYLRYKIGKNLTAELVGSNLTNRYYLDPMSRSYLPAPGRTIRIGITGKW
jgi:putative receptor protein